MNIAKYNIAPGSGSNARTGSTAVAGGGAAGAGVDITPLTNKIAALESRIINLERQLERANTLLAGLDQRFLSKLGDRSIYSYFLGTVYTDGVQSEMYDNGVGYRIAGNATAQTENKYNLIMRDVGWARIPFSTVTQSDVTYVNNNTDEDTAQLNALNISIGATQANGYLLVDCGVELTHDRCFTPIAKRVEYSTKVTIGQSVYIDEYREAEVDGNGNFIIMFQKADNITISIKYYYTYAFRKAGEVTWGTYRLYIRGTDPSNNQTDCFAAASKAATVNASGITVMDGNNGIRLTSGGIQTTADGGSTWT
jgi:hypothetical protein